MTSDAKVMRSVSAAASLTFGVFIWACDSLSAPSAFGAYKGVPVWIFSLPLIVGGALALAGTVRRNAPATVIGLMFSFTIFLSALISCLKSAPRSTGVPAYLGLSAIYLTLAALSARNGRGRA